LIATLQHLLVFKTIQNALVQFFTTINHTAFTVFSFSEAYISQISQAETNKICSQILQLHREYEAHDFKSIL
jgi:hypothetical protein